MPRVAPSMGVGAAPFGTPADFRDLVDRALSSNTKKHVALLGSTGSIGTQVSDASDARAPPGRIALAANGSGCRSAVGANQHPRGR
jgi:hypothetical protein